MKKIEEYFLRQNKIRFSDILHSGRNKSESNKKIVLKSKSSVVKKSNNNDKSVNDIEIVSKELKEIFDCVKNCVKCEELCGTRSNVVFGRGNENPDIVFVGEAPGADEDRLGLPFVGRAGKLLDRWIEKLGINEYKYYIMNALKCRPPNNRDPFPQEKINCRKFFTRQLEILDPKIICALGRHGFGNLIDFDLRSSFGSARNTVHYYRNKDKEVPVIATYHPAYVLRNQKDEYKVMDDLNFMIRELNNIKR